MNKDATVMDGELTIEVLEKGLCTRCEGRAAALCEVRGDFDLRCADHLEGTFVGCIGHNYADCPWKGAPPHA